MSELNYEKLWKTLKTQLESLLEDCPPIEAFEVMARGYSEVLNYMNNEECYYNAVNEAIDKALEEREKNNAHQE